MVFKCQEDSFLKEFTARVVTCEPTAEPLVEYGHTTPFTGYAVELEDTILFPAGGGQPHDHGWLDAERVMQVLRRGQSALHFVKRALPVGALVTQKLDWERRFDHMQQHSGQHLLSAVLEREHGVATSSWWLGADESYVELDSSRVDSAALAAAQSRCNALIRQAVPVSVTVTSPLDPELDEAHTRGLPGDVDAGIRVICIGDIDRNMCCGTHVSNLSQLQCIKLLGVEPGKKGKSNLRFVVGERVLSTFQRMQDRERALTALLNNDPSRHEELVQKLQKSQKLSSKSLQSVLGELAEFHVDKYRRAEPRPQFLFLFTKESTPEFNRAVARALEPEPVLLLLAAADPDRPNEGQLIVQGPRHHCDALLPKMTELVKSKGAFKNGKYQGKACDLAGLPRCSKLAEEYFSQLPPANC